MHESDSAEASVWLQCLPCYCPWLAAVARAPPASPRYTPLGCYKDRKPRKGQDNSCRALPAVVRQQHMTVESCAAYAKAQGSDVFGVQHGREYSTQHTARLFGGGECRGECSAWCTRGSQNDEAM